MTLTIDRKGEELQVPIAPAEGPDGLGRIGVQMAANAEIIHITSNSPQETLQLAAKQFGKLTKTVVQGGSCWAELLHIADHA